MPATTSTASATWEGTGVQWQGQTSARRAQAVVQKIVSELKDFDNLYYEVCNEPYERAGLAKEWNDQIIAAIVEAEASLPVKHLIAQNLARVL